MNLFELVFENIDIASVKYIFNGCSFGNVTTIGSLPESIAVTENSFVEKVIYLLNTKEEYVFINFDEAKFEGCHLYKPSLHFYKYDNKLDVNLLFEQQYNLITDEFLASLRAFSEKRTVQLKAECCFFGLEPSVDDDNQLFKISK
jgi:hypothetical protein